MKGLNEKNSKKSFVLLLILLFGLISMYAVNALIVPSLTNQVTIGVYNVSDKANDALGSASNFAYGAGNWNLTNVSSNRPFVRFNVTFWNGTGMNATLSVWPAGTSLNVLSFPYSNSTIVTNGTLSDLYFNNTWIDGYYTWALNASNDSLQGPVYNRSNITDFYVVIIDTKAPTSYYFAASPTGTSRSATTISLNVSSADDTGTVYNHSAGGGFVSFYLRNQSGLVNWTVFSRGNICDGCAAAQFNMFNATNVTTNITFTLPGVGLNLADGQYYFNASVNDSLGNVVWLTQRNLTIDTTNPTVTLTSSGGTSVARNQFTTISCAISDMHVSNMTVAISGETGTFCGGVSSCSKEFTSTIATTKTVTCSAADFTGNTNSKTLSITFTDSDNGGSGASSPPSSSSGGGRASTTGDVVANQPFTLNVVNRNLGVDSVTVVTTENAPNAKLEVNTFTDKPSGVDSPTANVYKYLEIKKTNLADSALKEATIAFRVTKQWLTDHNSDATDVVLFRLKDNVWESYTPGKSEDLGTEFKFEATVPGFSTFAIGVKAGTEGTNQEGQAMEETQVTEETGTTDETKVKTSFWPVVVVLVVLVLVGAGVWYFVERKK